jgi:hypothetical protein
MPLRRGKRHFSLWLGSIAELSLKTNGTFSPTMGLALA